MAKSGETSNDEDSSSGSDDDDREIEKDVVYEKSCQSSSFVWGRDSQGSGSRAKTTKGNGNVSCTRKFNFLTNNKKTGQNSKDVGSGKNSSAAQNVGMKSGSGKETTVSIRNENGPEKGNETENSSDLRMNSGDWNARRNESNAIANEATTSRQATRILATTGVGGKRMTRIRSREGTETVTKGGGSENRNKRKGDIDHGGIFQVAENEENDNDGENGNGGPFRGFESEQENDFEDGNDDENGREDEMETVETFQDAEEDEIDLDVISDQEEEVEGEPTLIQYKSIQNKLKAAQTLNEKYKNRITSLQAKIDKLEKERGPGMMDLGYGVRIRVTEFETIVSLSSSPSIFARNLMRFLFKEEELVNKSLFGRQTGGNKDPFPALEENRRNAVILATLKRYGKKDEDGDPVKGDPMQSTIYTSLGDFLREIRKKARGPRQNEHNIP